MPSLKILTKWCFIFGSIFGKVHAEQFDDMGLFDFRSTNHATDGKTDDFFADSNIMYDTLHETVFNANPGKLTHMISNETQVQKIKTYSRFLDQLGSFKRANANDFLKITKGSGRPKRTLRKIQLNANSLKSETSDQWTLLTKFFHQN